MLFIRQNGDDSRPKNAATCPAFLDEICAKFGRTMTRHILLSLQKQLSVVSIIFGPSKKNKPYWPSTFAQKSDAKRLRWKIKTATIFQNCLFESPQPKQSMDCFVTKMPFFFSTYKHTSTKSVRMYNVTFLEIRNVKTRLYALTVGPKTSRYYRNKKEWMTRSHRSEKAFDFDINLNAHFLRDKWHEKSG